MKKTNLKKSITIIWAIFLIVALVFAVACTAIEDNPTAPEQDLSKEVTKFDNFNGIYGANVYSAYNLETLDRAPLEATAGTLARYPEYNQKLEKLAEQSEDAFLQEKQAIFDENVAIFDYDQVDINGNLFKEGVALSKKLFKHQAAEGLYLGNVPNEAKAVTKHIRFSPYYVGNTVTGLYAPAGEVIKISIDSKYSGREFTAVIGATTRGESGNTIGVSRDFTRMPILHKTFKLQNGDNYIGSPLGGPIYLCSKGNKETATIPYEITISGAVEQPLYVHNYTTDEEWERLRNSAGLYFDMEITQGIRFCMPASYIRDKSAAEMREVSDFWYKAACLSASINYGGWTRWSPITMLFDTFVPAGAAVAFVNADFCILPLGWAVNSLNYNSINTDGAWGTLHEFNHHHQGWGCSQTGADDEVTNNVINTLTYMLYTQVAEKRTEVGGLAGWNWVSSAYHSILKQLEWNSTKTTPNDQWSMYATLAHSFGDKVMVQMANACKVINSTDKALQHTAWYKAVAQVTGFDPTYFLVDFCGFNDIDQYAIDEVRAKNLPMYIPVASLYQSGVVLNNKASKMGKPFVIAEGVPHLLDFDSYLAFPKDDFTSSIVKMGKPLYGSITQTSEQVGTAVYTYTPKASHKDLVDEFYVTIKLTDKQTGQSYNTVLIISLKQNTYAAEQTPEIPNYYPLKVENNGIIMLDRANVEIINAPTQYPGYIAENMLDGDPSTMLHTKPNLDFPLEFEFNFNEEVSFNGIQVLSRADGRARIKDYSLYIGEKVTSETGEEEIIYTLWANGSFENKVTATTTFKTLKTSYLKLVANSYYQENYNESYIAIREINFGKTLIDGNLFDNKNENIEYGGKWQEQSGGTHTYLNNSIVTTSNGEATLSFNGSDIAIYSMLSNDFGIMQVSIDGGEWQDINLKNATPLYQQAVYIQTGLQNTNHTLQIKAKSGNINFDYFATSGTISKFVPPPLEPEPEQNIVLPQGLGGWWVLIGFVITLIITALIIVVSYFSKLQRPNYSKSGFYSEQSKGKRHIKD